MSELQISLKIQKGIREYEDILVQKIEEAFKNQYGQLDPSQYQNLVQVALSTESSEVIKNFLRYQVGRDTKWGRGNGSLAEAIIVHIQGDLKKQSDEIAQIAGDPSQANVVHLELIRRYLGYGKRHLTFLKPRNK
ncbi:MAG: hypothetical protein VKJ24_13660 [Synechococcales bacterium]|nr:hypothetical protein [Synechococcales bacterium]